MIHVKRCVDCGHSKPIDEFPLSDAEHRRTRCAPCYRAYQRRFSRGDYLRHQPRRLRAAECYRDANRETVRERNRQVARVRGPLLRERLAPAYRARSIVRTALENGTLVRPGTCQQC